jgi:hypothetical protein
MWQKKENKAFWIVSDDLFIFFPHSSTLVCEIKGLRVEFYFSRDVASGEKIWSLKRGGGINIVFGQLYTPLCFTKIFILQQCLNPNPYPNPNFFFGFSQNIRIISDSDPQHCLAYCSSWYPMCWESPLVYCCVHWYLAI